ncbi:MAG: hypothetical protein K0Q81_1914 [Paenibacillus sp.]|jgi:bisphosphoglycerate-dependent phosphoglycerate mutase|nr:hypothetical protein [Paenibacillus sp.]
MKEMLSEELLLQIKSHNDKGLYKEQYDPSPVIDRMYHDIRSLQQEAEKWRVEAFRKYPTPEAYEAACKALDKHRKRADDAEQQAEHWRREYQIECERASRLEQEVNTLQSERDKSYWFVKRYYMTYLHCHGKREDISHNEQFFIYGDANSIIGDIDGKKPNGAPVEVERCFKTRKPYSL